MKAEDTHSLLEIAHHGMACNGFISSSKESKNSKHRYLPRHVSTELKERGCVKYENYRVQNARKIIRVISMIYTMRRFYRRDLNTEVYTTRNL